MYDTWFYVKETLSDYTYAKHFVWRVTFNNKLENAHNNYLLHTHIYICILYKNRDLKNLLLLY